MREKVILAVIALVTAIAAAPALASDVSADVLWAHRSKPQQADRSTGTTSIPAYHPRSLIGHPQDRSAPGLTGSTRDDSTCQCEMMDHAHH